MSFSGDFITVNSDTLYSISLFQEYNFPHWFCKWVMICGLRGRVGGGSGLTRAMSLWVLVRSYWKTKHLVGLSSSRKSWWAGRLRCVALSLGTMWTLKSDLGIYYQGELASNTWGNFYWVHSNWKGQDTDFTAWHWWQVALEGATSLHSYTL